MNGKKAIRANLICLAGLTVLAIVAALLWLLMVSLGDQQAAVGVLGVLLVAAASWCLCFVTLVILLAHALLKLPVDEEADLAEGENYEDRLR